LGHLLLKAAEVAAQAGLKSGGYRLVINNGPDGGESVPHLHCHILGGRKMPGRPAEPFFRVKLISWNVNGLRAVLKKNFLEFLEAEKPDVLCLQETKCSPDQVEQLWPAAYTTYWNSAVKPGYSGTAIFTRQQPLKVTPHLGITEHDQEGRVLTAEYDDFFLVNVYVPNSKRELTRLAVSPAVGPGLPQVPQKLEKKKPVIWCGDLNVAHTEIDLANPKANVKNHGFTPEERAGFSAFVNAGFMWIRSANLKRAEALHVVESDGHRPPAEHRVALGLLPDLASASPATQESIHPPAHHGQRPLSRGDRTQVALSKRAAIWPIFYHA
jgi:exodeoxyribonuclease-3